jgi:hypothetical protein
VNYATKHFNDAVADLKALCGTHTQLFEYGQFYVTLRTLEDMFGQIKADLSANLRFAGVPDELASAIAFFDAQLFQVPVLQINVAAIINMLNLKETNGDMAAIRALFVSTKEDEAHARADFNDVWSTTNISAYPLYSSSAASIGKAKAAYTLEKGKCWQMVRAFAAKLLNKRGGVRLLPTVILSEGIVAGAKPTQTAPGVPRSPGVDEVLARETLVYAQPTLLNAAVNRMKEALKAKGFVHCGVLSGAMHDHSVFPIPEHHILVFAHDVIDTQDAFLFWDPDAAHSNIASTSWGNGFGVLFSRNGRLCTGVDDADLADIERTKGVRTEGNHLRDPLRHSYQVYTLETLPLAARVKLHVKVLTPPTHASVDEMLGRAVGFFAANGLEVIELSRETIDTPGTDLDRFQMLFVGTDRSEATADVRDLHTTLRQPRDFGIAPAATELLVVFVDSMVPAHRGSAVHPPEQPGIIISAAHATEWTLAHEIGRVIGLAMSVAPGDLTFRSTEAIVEEPRPLSEDNLNFLFASSLVEV